MSRLIVAPDWLASAAAEVQSIGSALSAANAAAAAPTTLLVAAAEDEVSASGRSAIRQLRPGVSDAECAVRLA